MSLPSSATSKGDGGRWRRTRPDLTTPDGLADAEAWALCRLTALHTALAPWWPPSRRETTSTPKRPPEPESQAPAPYVRRATPSANDRLVDGDASTTGWADHEDTVARLHTQVIDAGLTPLPRSELAVECDLAWRTADTLVVVEVKSINEENESHQVRLGLGQVIDYRTALECTDQPIRAIVAVSGPARSGRWPTVCETSRVEFVDPPTFGTLFRQLEAKRDQQCR